MKHSFVVGQIVDLKPNRLQQAALGKYEIQSLMPLSDVSTNSPRYRIRSLDENHDRIAFEVDLTAIA